MEVRWQTNFEASAMHAAWVAASGRRLLDSSLAVELEPAALALSQIAQSHAIPLKHFWRQLIALSVELPANHDLADRLLRRLVGASSPASAVSQLSHALAGCEAIVRRRFPKLAEEIQLRIGPLHLAWEARGPGLLAMMRRTTEENFLVESAVVLPVQPICGGDGMAHLHTNRVHIEALLTDVDPRLPETLRLAWLLGQLNLDLPRYTEAVHGHTLAEVAELALIPIVLNAAQELQLAHFDENALSLALQFWARVDDTTAQLLAQTLSAWWETASAADWPWATSLTALAQMIEANSITGAARL